MKLHEILNIISASCNNNIELYMVHKVHSKKGLGYSIVNPTIGQEFKEQLKDIVQKQVEDYLDEPQENYNPVGTMDNTIEVAKVSKFNSINTLKTALEKPAQKFSYHKNSFNCFIYNFFYKDKNGDDKSILVFRRTKNFKSFNKGFIGYLCDGTFKKLSNKDMLATDEYIDFIMDDEDIYIFQHISFERIFNLQNKFLEKAKTVLSNKEFTDKIESFDELKKVALNDQSYIKRLAKLGTNNDSTLFLENLQETKKVIKDFNLGIELNASEDKLVFKSGGQVGSFIQLMQDAYYHTAIGNHKGIDKRR